ncbi:armadillo-type protein [Papiliotrema laurentii]|uniref:Armadillo-type protein n=1 Tax=Papiliotrema laurentii TaxID=5418 RepID=A0AAD9CTA0_PAPLA|nr:armadillo-type protein [Papiliotrema laurentii]
MSARGSIGGVQRLDFKEKLLEKGKRETGETLLRKVKTLHQKLSVLEQDQTDTKSLAPVTKPLVDNLILHHKDKGIRAFAACCLADLLRLYAPDAPYTAGELRNIFQFFCAQLTEHLRVPPPARTLQTSRSKTTTATQESQTQASQRITDVAYYAEYCYLLESLATIKSVVLACDVPGGEEIVTGFFEGFVKIIRSDMSKNIIRHLTNILIALVEESSAVPQGVMDVIIDQFTKHASKPDTPSFMLIVDVCNGAANRLQRPIYAHFAELQIAHGRNPTSEDMKAMADSHALMLTIWRYSPNVLLLVIPQLEENLRAADQAEIRNLTTRTLASMFGYRPRVGMTVAELAKAYPNTWKSWLGRKVDKSVQVRLTWVESSLEILANVPDLRKDLEGALVDRIQDSNEQVRAAICKVFGQLDYETTLHQISIDTLKAVGLRLGDKKAIVRNEAAAALSNLWEAAHSEIDLDEAEAVAHFAWIPQSILHCLQMRDLPVDGRTSLTSTFKTKILPLPSKADDEQAWVDRLLLVASHLDDDAGMAGLARTTGLVGYAKGSSPYRAFVMFCEENNGGVIDKDEDMVKQRLAFVINAIAVLLFSDSEKAKRDMEAFAAANDNRLYKLFKTCADPLSDLRSLLKAKNEFLRRIEQHHTDILDTFATIIENGSFNVLNTSSVSPLLRALQSPPSGPRRDNTIAASAKLLSLIAKECPPMFVTHVPELLICMGQKKNEKLVEVSLQALAAVCRYDREVAPKDRKNVDKVIQIALSGTPRQAKFAARFLSVCGHEGAPAELVEAILDQLAEKDESLLLTHLRGLAELALSSPQAVEAKADEIHRFVMAEVIYKKSDSSDDDSTDEWTEEENLTIIDRAKMAGLRFVTHRAIGFARDPEALKVATPVFNLLDAILKSEGEITEETKEGGHAKTQIRLRAALCLVKLAQVRTFDKNMTSFFEPISYIMQDPCYQVRHRLLNKLGEVLPAQRMLPRWNIMPAMIATDPEKDNPAIAKQIITSCVRACKYMPDYERIDRVEMPLARLLLVLAHHPDLDEWSLGITKDMAKYLDLYLECVISPVNAGMLYHIAAKVKQVKGLDMTGNPDEDNTNLYKLSELAQIIIRNKAEMHRWNLQTYPGKLRLPRDIFHNLHNPQAGLENTRRSYLTEEESSWARTLGRRGAVTAGANRRVDPDSSPAKNRVKTTKTGPRKRSRRADDTSEDESEDDEDEEEELTESAESEEEEEEGEAVIGRGGRRGAKTKAKRGLRGKKRSRSSMKKPTSKTTDEEAMDVDEESALSDAPSES